MNDPNQPLFPPGSLPPQRRPDDGMVGPLNELLARWFIAQGIPARSLGKWTVLSEHNAAAQLIVAKELSLPDSWNVRVTGSLQIAGLQIAEPVLGRGKTFLGAVEDALRLWYGSVFPVLLAAFFNKPLPGKVEQNEAVIGGLPRRVTVGNIGTWGRVPEVAPGQPDVAWFNHFVQKARARPLPAGTHWVRLFYAQAENKPVDLEVTLDNQDWSDVRMAMSYAPWPKAKEFFSVHGFLVIQDLSSGQGSVTSGQ